MDEEKKPEVIEPEIVQVGPQGRPPLTIYKKPKPRHPLPHRGRPKSPHTIETERRKAEAILYFHSELKPVLEALVKKAKNGNMEAIKEVLERSIGKIPNDINLNSNQVIEFINHIAINERD